MSPLRRARSRPSPHWKWWRPWLMTCQRGGKQSAESNSVPGPEPDDRVQHPDSLGANIQMSDTKTAFFEVSLAPSSRAREQNSRESSEAAFLVEQAAGSDDDELETIRAQVRVAVQRLQQARPATGAESSSGYGDVTPSDVQRAVKRAQQALRNYCSGIFNELRAPGLGGLDKLREMEPGASFHRPNLMKRILESKVSGILFSGFEDEMIHLRRTSSSSQAVRCEQTFQIYELLTAENLDPSANLSTDRALLWWACSKHADIASALGTLENEEGPPSLADLLLGNKKAVEQFNRLCKAVWELHALAFAFDPNVAVVRAAKGDTVTDNHMVVEWTKDSISEEGNQHVEFMCMPGFHMKGVQICCQVYPSRETYPSREEGIPNESSKEQYDD